jgi:HSP20 family protein
MESWTPFNRLSSLHDELNRLFDFSLPRRDTGLFSGWSPTLDVYDTKDHFFVKMELPGMKKEDIGITLQDGVLTVSGERKSDVEHKEGETFRSTKTGS